MKKPLFLSAYLRTNPGDDMMVLTLTKRYPNKRFFLYCHPRHRTCLSKEKNVRFVAAPLYYADRLLLRIIKKEPFRLHYSRRGTAAQIGGSMYIEPANFNPNSTSFQLNPQYIIGANFGPYKTEVYFKHIEKILSSASDVCFRDRYSAELFSRLPQVRQAPDVLFGYPDYPAPKTGNGIAISIIDPSSRPELQAFAENYFQTIGTLIDLCYEQNIPVTVLSFCPEEGDDNALRQIELYAKTRAWKRFTYAGDPAALLNIMNDCSCILATRFHAMIFGWMLQKKVMPIIYSNKQKTVLEDIGYRHMLWNLLEGQDYDPAQLLADCQACAKVENTQLLAQQAQEQFRGLDAYFA